MTNINRHDISYVYQKPGELKYLEKHRYKDIEIIRDPHFVNIRHMMTYEARNSSCFDI